MTTIKQAIDGVVAAIQSGLSTDTIAGRTYGFGKDSLDPPCIVVVPGPGDFLAYSDTFDGTDNIALLVKVIVGTQDSQSAQEALLGYLARSGSTSVRAAILASPPSGTTLMIPTAQNYGDVEWGGQQYFGFELPVAVLT